MRVQPGHLRWPLVVFFLFPVLQAQTPEARIDHVTVTERGVFEFKDLKDIPNEHSASRMGHLAANFILVEDTPTIPAKLGIHFGFRFLVVGQPAGAIVPLKIIRKFPEPGITNPATGKTTHQEGHTVRMALGTGDVTGYGFDHDFELVPGKWIWEVWSGDRKLAEQSFDVVEPK